MEKTRKIIVAIMALLVLTLIMATVDISIRLQGKKEIKLGLKFPKTGPGVGIVRVDGPIGMSIKRGPFGVYSGVEAVIRRLDSLGKNSNIKAIVVRINSPGGTVAAVQEIYEKIWKLRKKNIPIVASFGEIAASGGYYIASACNYIVSNFGTLTGSIGVIAASPNLKGLFGKLGIRMNVIKSGTYKDIFSSHRDMTKEETALIQEMINSSYRKFLKDVALGRNQNQSDIQPYADGRIITGEKALEYKLVDEIGTFEDSIDKARELAKLDSSSPVYDEILSPLQQILMTFDEMLSGYRTINENLNGSGKYRLEYRYMP